MDRRKIKVSCNGDSKSMFVSENKLKKETLERIFSTKGNLTYIVNGEVFCQDVDETNFILEKDVDKYVYEHIKVKEMKTPSGLTTTSRKIMQTHFISEQGFSSQDFDGCIIKVGKPDGTPIDNFTDLSGTVINIWTYASNNRDGSHNFNLCLLTTKIELKGRGCSESGKSSLLNVDFGVFGYKCKNSASNNFQNQAVKDGNKSLFSSSSNEIEKESEDFPKMAFMLKKQDSSHELGGSALTSKDVQIQDSENKSLSNSKKKETTDFPDAASMLKKQDSSYMRLNNQEVFKVPGTNLHEQTLMSVSIQKIELVGTVAQGGQGQVKKGTYRGTPVAVKFIQKGKWDKSALKEIALLAVLRHPNIICAIAQSSTPSEHVIVMEFFDGHCLHDIIFKDQCQSEYHWTVESKIKIAKQVCRAISFCHSHKPQPIIHRDMKPLNILVDTSFLTKLCDFGLGRCKDLRKSIQSTVKAGLVGTYGYMPPEIIVEGKEATTYCDTWSTGGTLTEMFSGEDLWGASISGILQMARKEKPNIMKVPETLQDIFGRIFNYNPEDRPTMMEVSQKFKCL